MANEVFRFDAESWCVVFCLAHSDVVQMTSNIADEVLANQHAQNVRIVGGHVFHVCKAGVLVAALELIKTKIESMRMAETKVEHAAYPLDSASLTMVRPWCTETGQNACSCRERDGSHVCEFCRLQGYRGHME